MSQIGSFALLLALGLSSYSFLAGLLALFGRDAGSMRLGETARRAGIAAFGAVVLAAVVLVTAAFRDDFSIAYIFHHSNRDLPAPYKFAVLWSGQEGSLLFWSLLLGGYGFVLRLRYKTDQRLFAHASVVIAAVQVFFLMILNFAAHPFAIMEGALPPDGNGLNPLLQYPEMVIHPPMLYLGYVGFTVPFAFALGALIMKYPGEKWIQITRRWTMVTWCFLTIGVFLGAHWAYAVLGWGGYWGWDPVENASLMPWLTGTAFLHSVMMQEKRGMLKVWNMWLIFATFLLSHARNFPDALGRDQFGACVCAVVDRRLVHRVHGPDAGYLRVLLREEQVAPEERAQTGIAGFARVEFSVQQPAAAGGLLHRAVGHVLPHPLGVGAGTQSHGGRAVL